jgi:hypothetical protein
MLGEDDGAHERESKVRDACLDHGESALDQGVAHPCLEVHSGGARGASSESEGKGDKDKEDDVRRVTS